MKIYNNQTQKNIHQAQTNSYQAKINYHQFRIKFIKGLKSYNKEYLNFLESVLVNKPLTLNKQLKINTWVTKVIVDADTNKTKIMFFIDWGKCLNKDISFIEDLGTKLIDSVSKIFYEQQINQWTTKPLVDADTNKIGIMFFIDWEKWLNEHISVIEDLETKLIDSISKIYNIIKQNRVETTKAKKDLINQGQPEIPETEKPAQKIIEEERKELYKLRLKDKGSDFYQELGGQFATEETKEDANLKSSILENISLKPSILNLIKPATKLVEQSDPNAVKQDTKKKFTKGKGNKSELKVVYEVDEFKESDKSNEIDQSSTRAVDKSDLLKHDSSGSIDKFDVYGPRKSYYKQGTDNQQINKQQLNKDNISSENYSPDLDNYRLNNTWGVNKSNYRLEMDSRVKSEFITDKDKLLDILCPFANHDETDRFVSDEIDSSVSNLYSNKKILSELLASSEEYCGPSNLYKIGAIKDKHNSVNNWNNNYLGDFFNKPCLGDNENYNDNFYQ